ncbi:hypothetical protein [Dyadobacter psychrotolerans]|uniref:DUF2157 domain-containing protein n=1 Tax=Dyadobacter psychrotolerans TaxID=2541721 RepID=A0A4R5DZ11_9BACT|nr:hypothetical protein [Dyadobacter psychrotolerans]TDE17401.1 hypothetical protein E0F88_05780 [Dyadobacter psychrotolerans]
MKKGYNETWVDNLAIERIAKSWLSDGLISAEQFSSVEENFPHNFYRPGLFVRIGLFLFACIACSFFSGFLSLMLYETGKYSYVPITLLSFSGFVFMLNYLIKDRRLFHSGVDNALLYSAVFSLLACMFLYFEDRLEIPQYCMIILVILSVAIYIYADIFCSAAFFATFLTLLANLMLRYELGKALLPFAVLIVSGTSFALLKTIRSSYYEDCIVFVKVLSLICSYLGGNYLVVREANAMLNNFSGAVSPQISFAPLFWFCTIAIPVGYIFFGLKGKNRMLLVTGLICLAFSVFTYRFYYDFLTVAQVLVVAGIFMLLFAVWAIKYLKEVRLGISDLTLKERANYPLEALLAAQFANHHPAANVEPGAGSFSGAGAGGDF